MSLVTVYIGVLILALIIGNGLLSLTKGHGPPRRQAVRQARQRPPEPQNIEKVAPAPTETSSAADLQFESRLKALDEMTKMAHGRIEDLENQFKGAPSPALPEDKSEKDEEAARKQSQNLEELKAQSAQLFREMSDKIRSLDNFKANTKVELQGVKEVAANMQAALKEISDTGPSDDNQELLLELDEIQSRLDRLHAFKTNTEVELKALKELVLLLKEMLDRPKGVEEPWLKNGGRSKNFDQDLEKFRRVSVNMKRLA